jgi:hypothetical protein
MCHGFFLRFSAVAHASAVHRSVSCDSQPVLLKAFGSPRKPNADRMTIRPGLVLQLARFFELKLHLLPDSASLWDKEKLRLRRRRLFPFVALNPSQFEPSELDPLLHRSWLYRLRRRFHLVPFFAVRFAGSTAELGNRFYWFRCGTEYLTLVCALGAAVHDCFLCKGLGFCFWGWG